MAMFVPAELMIDIFLRFPVKSILGFRCVCRDWRNVIDSKNFTNMHLIKRKINCCLIVQAWGKPCLYSVNLNSLEDIVRLDVRSWWPKDRWYEFYGVKLRGSCNGLLCLSSCSRDVALWNPSTKKHLLLPPLSFDHGQNLTGVFGFGYDLETDDYKVVRIVQRYTSFMSTINTVVKVFSLRSNLWRQVYNGFLKESLKGVGGVLVRNSLHWLLTSKHEQGTSIVAFDLRTEELEVFSFASSMEGWASEEITIQVIEERIAVSVFLNNEGFELWVMEEYGAKESWTKLISIAERSLRAYNHVWPIQCYRNRKMLVGARSKGCPIKAGSIIFWFDFQTMTIENIWVSGLPDNVYDHFLCSESLVPLHGSAG